MLRTNDLLIVQAALLFWQEEMCPHGEDVMRPYFRTSEAEPLSAQEVEDLRRQFNPARLRYAAYDITVGQLTDTELFVDAEEAIQSSEIGHVATVLAPTAPSV